MRISDFGFKFKAEDVTETGRFVGYAAIFGNVDQGGDVIAPGAFAKSLSRARREERLIPMLWQHNRDEPIGKWLKLEEDAKGLLVEGQLHIDFDPLAKRAYGHLKAESVGGFSIGYRLPDGGYSLHPDYEEGGPVMWLLSEVDLREASIVTMPMNIEAKLVSVKSHIEAGGMPTPREFEYLLREACGFSKRLAGDICHLAKPLLSRGEPGTPAAPEFLQSLAAAAKAATV